MPKTGTELQQRFVVEFVANGGNATSAAKVAGYSMKTAGQIGFKLLGNAHVQDAIRAEQRRLLHGDLATKALGVLRAILDDEKAPTGARVDAAKTILDRAGLVALRPEEVKEDVPLHQMSAAALARTIDAGEQRIAQLEAVLAAQEAGTIEGDAVTVLE